ncbi:MAG: isoprenylcysteine carboxylmethyltransferase family protein [Candidatus Hydrogenedentes bacterium]|nr:isoprenylcysteine carboxylmethyltransferase family protein [Candidatus Hydrogenedentota bacterium]
MAPLYLLLACLFVGETEWDALIWPVGLVFFFLGVAIRVWAQTHLHYRLRVRKSLTTTGPYMLVRNPIYIANTTMLLALTVLSELLWLLPVMFVWCVLVYSFVIRREERHLLEKYGEPYREFMARVPRWVPRRPRGAGYLGVVRQFLRVSLLAETHCLLLLLPMIGKECLWDLGK